MIVINKEQITKNLTRIERMVRSPKNVLQDKRKNMYPPFIQFVTGTALLCIT